MKHTEAEIREALSTAMEIVKGQRPSPDANDVSLLVYEVDSLDLIEMQMIVEEELDLRLPDINYEGASSLRDVVKLIQESQQQDG